jgi:hypothetical protein
MAKPYLLLRKLIDFILLNPFIVSTPIIEVIEDDSESVDEDDMTFLTGVLAQFNPNLHHQDNLQTSNFQTEAQNETRNQ